VGGQNKNFLVRQHQGTTGVGMEQGCPVSICVTIHEV